ncbi:MAG: mevalonate kinase [Anaerolineales bacterium]
MSDADASAKSILFGEHAVVYGQPAIAVPLPSLRAHAQVRVHKEGDAGQIQVVSEDLQRQLWLHECDPQDPLAAIVRLTLRELEFQPDQPLLITIHSDIPTRAGLGSGAAVSIAIARALTAFAHAELTPPSASRLAFEVERIHHGSPSGIDNTVIAYEQPVYYVRDQTLQPFHLQAPLQLVLADTGQRTGTAEAVAGVRSRREQDSAKYDLLFEQIGGLVEQAHTSLFSGDHTALGPLMNHNQELLRSIGVSSSKLEGLIQAALEAGAQGAKLTGAGNGGYMLALVDEESSASVRNALQEAGGAGIKEVEVGT